jgi:hypothetical protein
MAQTRIMTPPRWQRLHQRLFGAVSAWRNTIMLADDVPMSRKLNLTGYRWLRSHYDSAADLSARWPCKWTPRDFDLLFSALVIQANPGMSDDDALETARRRGLSSCFLVASTLLRIARRQ